MAPFKKRSNAMAATIDLLGQTTPQFPVRRSTHGTGFQIELPMAGGAIIFVQRDHPSVQGAMYTYVRILNGRSEPVPQDMVPATASARELHISCIQEIAQTLSDFGLSHAEEVDDATSLARQSTQALQDLMNSGLLVPRRQ